MKANQQAANRRSRQGETRTEPLDDETYLITGISPWRLAFDRAFLSVAARTVRWVLGHWLLLANLSTAATVAGAMLTPFLMAQGWVTIARTLFASYGLICAQNPAHSYFVFGYQMAIDQRMLAIYIAATLAGLVYAPLRSRLRVLSWRWYLVLIAPMAIDGFTQLFGWRHSNWELRSTTGLLFGIASVWWLYPFLEREIARLRRGLAEEQSCSKREPTASVVQLKGGQL